jgi:predicted metal-dependent hydrolase
MIERPGSSNLERPLVTDYPAQYREGLRLFNEEEFFDAHDIWEELWAETQGEEKKFIQGLIQASVALFHFGNENFGGAKKLYHSSRKYLEPYGDDYMGLELGRFLADFQICFRELIENAEAYPTTVFLKDELVPKMHVSDQALIAE